MQIQWFGLVEDGFPIKLSLFSRFAHVLDDWLYIMSSIRLASWKSTKQLIPLSRFHLLPVLLGLRSLTSVWPSAAQQWRSWCVLLKSRLSLAGSIPLALRRLRSIACLWFIKMWPRRHFSCLEGRPAKAKTLYAASHSSGFVLSLSILVYCYRDYSR